MELNNCSRSPDRRRQCCKRLEADKRALKRWRQALYGAVKQAMDQLTYKSREVDRADLYLDLFR